MHSTALHTNVPPQLHYPAISKEQALQGGPCNTASRPFLCNFLLAALASPRRVFQTPSLTTTHNIANFASWSVTDPHKPPSSVMPNPDISKQMQFSAQMLPSASTVLQTKQSKLDANNAPQVTLLIRNSQE